MLGFCDCKQFGKGLAKVGFCCAVMVSMAAIGTEVKASECYHHYNDAAWHDAGMAIVFCKNSGGLTTADDNADGEYLPMKACEIRYQNGEKIMDWHEHIATDHRRQIFTTWDTPGWTLGGAAIDVVCTGYNNKTYTYRLETSTAWSDPQVCLKVNIGNADADENYVGGSKCVNDHNPILQVTKGGEGTGTVTGNVAGDVTGDINCGTSCSADTAHYQYFSNKKVTLTAKPDAGYIFKEWQGACSGSGTCQLTMSSDKTVTALFEKPSIGPAVRLLGPSLFEEDKDKK